MRALIRCPASVCLLAAALATALPVHAQAQEVRRNWFNDPFVQLTSAIAACPQPAGPFITLAEKQQQAHHRIERGTSCWLAGQCRLANSYAYDAGIASDFLRAWPAQGRLAQTSLWLTVQGRVIWVDGCVGDVAVAGEIEALAKGLADVQQVTVRVVADLSAPLPYPQLPPP